MRLIYPAYREGVEHLLVHPPACLLVLIIERASMLIDKYSVILECLITVAVKLPCEEALRRTERVCGIIYNKVIHIRLGA